jgi:hypothetical protein
LPSLPLDGLVLQLGSSVRFGQVHDRDGRLPQVREIDSAETSTSLGALCLSGMPSQWPNERPTQTRIGIDSMATTRDPKIIPPSAACDL